MMFLATIPVFLSLGLAMSASAPVPRQSTPSIPPDITCTGVSKYVGDYTGFYSAGVAEMTFSCLDKVKAAGNDDIWGIASCVAAATSNGPENVIILSKCQRKGQNSTFPDRPNTSNLNYNIYASIVGDCAWQDGGCPITQQNYVDFLYGQLSAANASSYPNYDDVIRAYWNPIKTWANTGDSIPYVNFNDWLHYGTNQ